MTKPAQTSGMVSVYDGTRCLGFVMCRGKLGYEALNADEQSLGKFPNVKEAAAAVVEKAVAA